METILRFDPDAGRWRDGLVGVGRDESRMRHGRLRPHLQTTSSERMTDEVKDDQKPKLVQSPWGLIKRQDDGTWRDQQGKLYTVEIYKSGVTVVGRL